MYRKLFGSIFRLQAYNVNYKSILSGLLFVTTILSATIANSQAKYNIEVGFSYCMANAEYKTRNSFFNEGIGLFSDSSNTEKIKSKGGFGGLIGFHFPIVKMGDYSSISFSASYMYDALLWESNGFSYSSNSRTGTTSSGSGTIRMGLPVGVDYKFGCDAVSDKSKRLCTSFGAGLYPSISLTTFRDESNGNFRMLPYLKGEVGVFGGICIKLRGTLTFGNINYIDYAYASDNYNSSTSLKGRSTFTLSLVFMPLSYKWGRNEWWGR